MARRCRFKGNKRWMKWSWNAQTYQREDKKTLRRRVRRTEDTEDKEDKEEVLIQEDIPEDENGRKKKKIKKTETKLRVRIAKKLITMEEKKYSA